MKLFALTATALLAFAVSLPAQETGTLPETKAPASKSQTTQAPTQPSAPATKSAKGTKTPMEEAPGGGPDKVWVNTNSSVYHCPGDRFYGKTAHGRYMTEAAAKSAGAKGVGGKTCFAGK